MDRRLGRMIKEGVDTDRIDFRRLFPILKEHNLNGYMALDLLTNNGVEEGTLLYRDGDIIAAEYRYLAKELVRRGDDALKSFLNGCMGAGNFDVYELSEKEIVEAREKNRESVLKYKPTNKELFDLMPDTFTESLLETERKVKISDATVKSAGGVSREDVLKKYGISHPDERMLDTLLRSVSDGAV